VNKARPVVYVAGPLTPTVPEDHARFEYELFNNISAACKASVELIRNGLAPIVPHLFTYCQDDWPRTEPCGIKYETWLEVCFAQIEKADALLRLAGASPGADREVAHAQSLGIPVYGCAESLIEYWGERHGPTHQTIVTTANGAKQSKLDKRADLLPPKAMLRLAEVLHEGTEKYGPTNWRGISKADHLNHAICHLFELLSGAGGEDHLAHATCRLLFAMETK
jgi:hypothetical protein